MTKVNRGYSTLDSNGTAAERAFTNNAVSPVAGKSLPATTLPREIPQGDRFYNNPATVSVSLSSRNAEEKA